MMLGRGLLMNPELVLEIQSYEKCIAEGKEWKGYQTSFAKLKEYHAPLLQGYLEQMNGDATNVLFKMKELWGFLGQQFPNERLVKKMIKANHLKEYMELAAMFFERETE